MATATRTPPDLHARLADAHRSTEKLRGELSAAEQDLSKALERQDFRGAEQAQERAAEVRPHLLLAEAEEKALTEALAALDAQRQAEQAAAQRQAMEAQARAEHAAAAASDREAGEQMQRHFAEAMAGLAAVRTSLQMAKQAENAQTGARQAAYQALVTLGEREPAQFIAGSNWATARIQHSQLLSEILRSSEF